MQPAIGQRRAEALAFLAALVALAAQVLVHRMVQAKLMSNFAFFVLSLTMLGFAASGIVLTLLRRLLEERLSSLLSVSAAGFGASLVVAMAVFYRAPTGEAWAASRAGFLSVFLYCGLLALLFALPFGCCGVILGALLSRPDLEARRVYFADLVGSACGALVAIPAIRLLGVETSALALCALLLVGTAAACGARPPRARVCCCWRRAGRWRRRSCCRAGSS